MNSLQAMLGLCVAAYGIHILEEYVFDWQSWARAVLHLPARWNDFYITNLLVVLLGAVAVTIAPVWPAVALSFPGLMLINATFFHVAPFVWAKGRFSPGLITALCLFYPCGIATFRSVPLSTGLVVSAFGIGALLMATPIVFLKLKQLPYFDQSR